MSEKRFPSGAIVATNEYFKVLDVERSNQHPSGRVVMMQDNSGTGYSVDYDIAVDKFLSSDYVTKTVQLSKTALAEEFVKVGDKPFLVSFNKKDGSERILRGRHLEQVNILGYSQVIDLEISKGYNQRQVNHESINYFICNGTKNELKK